MDDNTKAPPPTEALREEDSKLPAATSTPAPKKLKTNDGTATAAAVAVSASSEEMIDIAQQLNFQPGDKFEVKWTINDDDDSEEGGDGNKKDDAAADNEVKEKDAANNGGSEESKAATVWWPATLSGRTDKVHTLTEEEWEETDVDKGVKLPVYTLNYAPLEEYGFESHSLEEVAFISDKTLLNLSTDEIMIFRKEGEKSPPSSPIPSEMMEESAGSAAASAAAASIDTSAIAMDCNGQEEVRKLMEQIMANCLKSTGMDKKMKSLSAFEQRHIAARIHKAKEGMLDKLMGETAKMGSGNKVITEDVVRRCMAQMDGGY